MNEYLHYQWDGLYAHWEGVDQRVSNVRNPACLRSKPHVLCVTLFYVLIQYLWGSTPDYENNLLAKKD